MKTTTTTQLYGNWIVLHPDGFEMFRCDNRRAEWYLSRELAKKVGDHVMQFTFTPRGTGHRDEPYYLQSLPNVCFVCGTTEQMTKHHVVPYQFRKVMPIQFKEGNCHDVVWLCRPHHDEYEVHAWELRLKLIREYGIPLQYNSPELKEKKKSLADLNALKKYSHLMGEERKVFLEGRVRQRHGIEQITPQTIDILAAELESQIDPLVVDQRATNRKMVKAVLDAFGDLHDFMRLWRQHFLDKMKPQHMPQHWSVDYRKRV